MQRNARERLEAFLQRSVATVGFTAALSLAVGPQRLEAHTVPASDFNGQKAISDRQLAREIRHQRLLPISTDALTDEGQISYDFVKMYLGLDLPVPVYVDPRDSDNRPAVSVRRTQSGHLFAIVNEAAHHWTPDLALDQMLTDRDVKRMTRRHTLIPAERIPKERQVQTDMLRMAQGMDITPIPELYIDRDPSISGIGGGATQTKSGRNVIILPQVSADSLDATQQEGILCHELGHSRNHDGGVALTVAMHNDLAVNRQEEAKADANILDRHCTEPQGALRYFQDMLTKERRNYFKLNPKATEADFIDFDRTADLTHPPLAERTQMLRQALRDRKASSQELGR